MFIGVIDQDANENSPFETYEDNWEQYLKLEKLSSL